MDHFKGRIATGVARIQGGRFLGCKGDLELASSEKVREEVEEFMIGSGARAGERDLSRRPALGRLRLQTDTKSARPNFRRRVFSSLAYQHQIMCRWRIFLMLARYPRA